jgi:hypothetical protein
VYCLWHYYCEKETRHCNGKHLGIYSTPQKAEEAIAFLRDKEGFNEYPDGFEIREVTPDRVGWLEGFRDDSPMGWDTSALGLALPTPLTRPAQKRDFYMLWHYYDDEHDNEQDRAVGAFSTEENAERARLRAR